MKMEKDEKHKQLIERERLKLTREFRKLVRKFSEKTGQNVVEIKVQMGFSVTVCDFTPVTNVIIETEDRFKRIDDIKKRIKFRKNYGSLNEN